MNNILCDGTRIGEDGEVSSGRRTTYQDGRGYRRMESVSRETEVRRRPSSLHESGVTSTRSSLPPLWFPGDSWFSPPLPSSNIYTWGGSTGKSPSVETYYKELQKVFRGSSSLGVNGWTRNRVTNNRREGRNRVKTCGNDPKTLEKGLFAKRGCGNSLTFDPVNGTRYVTRPSISKSRPIRYRSKGLRVSLPGVLAP